MFTRAIHTLTRWVGHSCALMTLLMTLLTTAIVLLRYVFGIGFIALQETATYLHASIFMLGVSYALQQQAHVRVDIFYKRWSVRQQQWLDTIGHMVLLLPLAAFMVYISIDFVANSWAIKEQSSDAGGLAIVYVLKALIPLCAILLALQCSAQLVEHIKALLTRTENH